MARGQHPEEIRRAVRGRRPKPPPPPKPPRSREERLLARIALAMEEADAPPGGVTPERRAGYKGAARGFLAGLKAGAFRRRWKRDRDLVRAIQLACARWIEGTGDAV